MIPGNHGRNPSALELSVFSSRSSVRPDGAVELGELGRGAHFLFVMFWVT
jgi:hypothetical protein